MKDLLIKILLVLLVVVTAISISLRFSEVYGPMARRGCVLAIGLSLFAAVAGTIPLLRSSKEKADKFFIALLFGSGLRVFVTAVGIVVIIVTAEREQRFWFLAWTVVFYLLFLCIETIEAVYCMKKMGFGNDFDTDDDKYDACEYESS